MILFVTFYIVILLLLMIFRANIVSLVDTKVVFGLNCYLGHQHYMCYGGIRPMYDFHGLEGSLVVGMDVTVVYYIYNTS